MGIFSSLLEKKYTAQLEKQMVSGNFQRASLSWNEAKSIGILFESIDANLNNEISDFIKKNRKKGLDVVCLALVDNKIETKNFIFDTFSKKNVSWAQIPNLNEINDFHLKEFDILLNFYPIGNKALEYISIVSRAKMRIGLFGTNIDCSDLQVGNENTKTFSELVSESRKVLSQMAVGA